MQFLAVDGREVPLTVRRHRRARRISLRVDAAAGGLVLTLPSRTPEREGMAFVREQAGWIATRIAALPLAAPFRPGAHVPYLGVEHLIVHRPDARGHAWRENGAIHVAGRIEHLPRRLTDWLKGEARREIGARARAKAARLGRTITRITVRDTRSRWGSCTEAGALSFSWRLVLAPEAVLDYVVAHEVAHLAEMNHGRKFWALVDDMTTDRADAVRWLGRHGEGLHRYG